MNVLISINIKLCKFRLIAFLTAVFFLIACTGTVQRKEKTTTQASPWPTPLPIVRDRLSKSAESTDLNPSPGILYVPLPYQDIWLLDPRSDDRFLIASTEREEEKIEGVVWAPDYSHFMYITGTGGVVVNFNSGHSTRFADKMYLRHVKWTTSSMIYYCVFEHVESDEETTIEPCFLYDVDSGETFPMAFRTRWIDEWQAVYTYQVSPGYRHIAFTSKNDSNYYLVDTTTGIVKSIYEMNFDFPSEGGALFGRWSPDGQQLAFSVSYCCIEDAYQSSLYVVEASGRDLRQIIDLNAAYPQQDISQPFDLQWSPDGQWLSFRLSKDVYDWSSPKTFHLVRSTGDELQDLEIRSHGSLYDWSPDGQHLLVGRKSSRLEYALYIVNINTREETQITHDGKHINWFDW